MGASRERGRAEEHIKRLHRRQRECERDIDAAYRRLDRWHERKTDGWQRRAGESLKKTVAVGGINAVLTGREIKKERQHIRELYRELYSYEARVEEELDALDQREEELRREKQQREERREEAQRELSELRGELESVRNKAATDRARAEELYAQVGDLERELEAERDGRQAEARDYYQKLAQAKAELEEWRVQDAERAQGDEQGRYRDGEEGRHRLRDPREPDDERENDADDREM